MDGEFTRRPGSPAQGGDHPSSSIVASEWVRHGLRTMNHGPSFLRLHLVLHFLESHVGLGDALVHPNQAPMRSPVHEEHGERFP